MARGTRPTVLPLMNLRDTVLSGDPLSLTLSHEGRGNWSGSCSYPLSPGGRELERGGVKKHPLPLY